MVEAGEIVIKLDRDSARIFEQATRAVDRLRDSIDILNKLMCKKEKNDRV